MIISQKSASNERQQSLASIVLIFIMLFFFIFSTPAFAAGLGNVSVSPDSVWIDSSTGEVLIDLYIECISDSAVNVTASVTGPYGYYPILMDIIDNDTDAYGGSFVATDFGNYTVHFSCGNSNGTENMSLPFVVNELDLELISISETLAYAGNVSAVKARLLLNDNPVTLGVEYSISFSNNGNSWKGDIFDISFEDDITVLGWTIPAFDGGIYDLEVTALLDGHTVSAWMSDPVTIRPPVEIEILNPLTDRTYSLTNPKQIKVVVRVKHNPFLIDKLYQSQFCAELDGKRLQIENFTYDSKTDTYSFFVDIYRADSDDYNYKLFVCVTPEGFSKQKSSSYVPVQFMIPFEIDLKDAKDVPISGARIALIKNSGGATYDECVTDSSGLCSVTINPGTYDITMDIDDVSLKLRDVELPGEGSYFDNAENILRYDNPVNLDIDGFKDVMKVVAARFLLSYESAEVSIYNIGPDSDTSVLRCDDWNFEQRSCSGTWSDISASSDYFSNKIIFTTAELSAFALGEKDDLHIDLDLGEDKYFIGGEYVLRGTVRNSKGHGVEGVKIDYDFGGDRGTTLTDSYGIFTADVKVPATIWEFKAILDAKKEPYISAKSISYLKAYERESLDMVLARYSLIVAPDVDYLINATLRNNGNIVIEEIRVTLSGFQDEWYEIIPALTEALYPGEDADFVIKISVPESYDDCDSCADSYSLSLLAESEGGLSIKRYIALSVEADDTISEDLGVTVGEDAADKSDIGLASLSNAITGFIPVEIANNQFYIILFLLAVLLFFRKPILRQYFRKANSSFYLDHIKAEVLKGYGALGDGGRKESAKEDMDCDHNDDDKPKKKESGSNQKSDLKKVLSDPFE